jgi:hypothetical protein
VIRVQKAFGLGLIDGAYLRAGRDLATSRRGEGWGSPRFFEAITAIGPI